MRPRLIVSAVFTTVAVSLSPVVAHAAPAPVTGVGLNGPENKSVAVDAQFNPDDAYTVGLQALRQLRGEMWDLNPRFTLHLNSKPTHLQDIAAEYRLNNKQEYVNGFSIDHTLTRIAIQRAVEETGSKDYTQTRKANHIRPDGTDFWKAMVNPTFEDEAQTVEEALDAGSNLRDSILNRWGRSQLDGLNKVGGHSKYESVYLHLLLNPQYRYYGFAQVSIPGSKHGTYTVAEANTVPHKGTKMPTGEQRVWLYRPAAPGEKPTGLRKGVPGPLRDLNGPSSAGESSGGAGPILGIIFGVLGVLGIIAGIARQLGLLG